MSSPPSARPASHMEMADRRRLLADIRELFRGDDRRHLAEIALLLIALACTTYAVGWVSWQTWGLAPGTPPELVHTIFDRWDVFNYVIIAEDGYGSSTYHAVWFPAMPGLMRLGSYAGIAPWLTGTVIALACTAGLAGAFYALNRLDLPPLTSRNSTIFLLVFPSSFFLFVPYTESMLLVLAVAAFYFARKGYWGAAAACAGLASGVRLAGAFLGPALAVEYLHQAGWQWRRVRPDAAWLLLAPAGLIAYMVYQGIALDDPLEFYHRQYDFPRLESVRTQGGLLHFIPSLIDEARVVYISESFSEQWQNAWGLGAAVVFAGMFALMIYYRLRPSYLVWAALAGFTPLLIGRAESINRYIIVAFPMFIVLGLVVERWPQARMPMIVAFLSVFYLSAARFAAGEWAG